MSIKSENILQVILIKKSEDLLRIPPQKGGSSFIFRNSFDEEKFDFNCKFIKDGDYYIEP